MLEEILKLPLEVSAPIFIEGGDTKRITLLMCHVVTSDLLPHMFVAGE